jgi:hypothetical protein
VTKTHRLWHHAGNIPQRIGSAVVVGDHAYLINEQGLGQCFDLKTGRDLWGRERLAPATWGSLVAAGDRLYVTAMNGETVVLAADPGKPEVLARNRLNERAIPRAFAALVGGAAAAPTRNRADERVLASIAVSDGELFIRGYRHLWCIAENKGP